MNTILALGLYKGSGGPSKSVRAMRRTLDGEVISWVDPIENDSKRLIWENTAIVRGSRIPVLRQLLIPATGETAEAEKRLRESELLSCHSPWRWHMIWLNRMSRKLGTPYWFVPHGGLDPYVFESQGTFKRAFLHAGGRRAVEEAGCVIFTTKAERDKALRVCQPKRSEIIYWPLEEEDFSMERNDNLRDQARSELCIPANALCLMYLGRLDSMKRPLETIEAVADGGENVHLMIIGNDFGISADTCCITAARLGVSHRVHVLGAVYGSEKSKYFSAADAYISLSKRENFNFSAAESMAAGLPLILSEGNDLHHELERENCAWVVDGKNTAEVSQLIRNVSQIPRKDLDSMGQSGAEWAQRFLTYERFSAKISSLEQELKCR